MFDFYTDAISSHKIVRFLNDTKVDEYVIKNRIDSLAGIGKIDENLALVVDKKLMFFDFKTKKLKLLIKPVKPIEKLFIKNNFLYAKINDKILMFDKNLKFIKTLKDFKAPKRNKTAYYSKTDNTIYYKSFSTKAKEIIYNVFETNKYIIAIGQNAYVYDKRLNLLKKLMLNKKVFAYAVSKDGIFYYAIYDKIFGCYIKQMLLFYTLLN